MMGEDADKPYTLKEADILTETKRVSNQIFTIPNVLSMVRIALIPVIVWLYHVEDEYLLAAGVLVVSGITDVVDGIIARRYDMITDLGKALDPVADKLTQTAMLVCLLFRFPLMGVPLALMVVKEFISAIWRLLVIRRTKQVNGAEWHGKVATVMLYGMMVLHMAVPFMPPAISMVCIILCSAMMILSFALYSLGNYRALKAG